MSLIRVVSFDVTQTLIKVTSSVGQQYAEAAKKHFGADYDGEALERSFLKIYSKQRKLFPCFGALHGISSSDWWLEVFSKCMIDDGQEMAGMPGFDPACSVIRKAFQDVYENFKWTLMPGTMETLNGLKNVNSGKYGPLKLAAITNSDERTSIILSDLNILHYFDSIMTSVEAKCEKPEPKIFLNALQKLHLPELKMNQILHVGDSYHGDYLGAIGLGMHSLFLQKENNKNQLFDKSHAISDVRQVLPFIQNYNSARCSNV